MAEDIPIIDHPVLTGKPSPFPIATALEEEEPPISPTIIEKFAKKMGFVKKPSEEPENVKQFKIALLTFLMLVLGDLIIFFGAAIDLQTGLWNITPSLWQTLIMAIIKDTSVGLIGKILKYYNKKD